MGSRSLCLFLLPPSPALPWSKHEYSNSCLGHQGLFSMLVGLLQNPLTGSCTSDDVLMYIISSFRCYSSTVWFRAVSCGCKYFPSSSGISFKALSRNCCFCVNGFLLNFLLFFSPILLNELHNCAFCRDS